MKGWRMKILSVSPENTPAGVQESHRPSAEYGASLSIGAYTLDEYQDLIRSFHGGASPGLLIGGFMVDLALKSLPPGQLLDALCETRACLPDAVQLLTPCSIGNGWLKILDFGRYALTLYEKYEGQGVRVFLDPQRLEAWPEIHCWFFKTRPKRSQDSLKLHQEIISASSSICGLKYVKVQPQILVHKGKGPITICPVCGEGYPAKHGTRCRACQEGAPYCESEPPTE